MDQAPPAAGNAVTAPAAAGLLTALGRGLPDGRLVTDPDVLAAEPAVPAGPGQRPLVDDRRARRCR